MEGDARRPLSRSTPRTASLLCACLAVGLPLACDDDPDGGVDGDGDGDGDVDVDADTDVDSDADADGNPDADLDLDMDWRDHCGHLGQRCCPEAPNCEPGTACADDEHQVEWCYAECDLGQCAYGEWNGGCVDIGDHGICVIPVPTSVDCTPGEDGCATEYGSRSDTTCLNGPDGLPYCFERCTPIPSGCPAELGCYMLASGETAICVEPP